MGLGDSTRAGLGCPHEGWDREPTSYEIKGLDSLLKSIQREDPSSHYNICLGELSSEVTDAAIFKLLMLHYSPFACFSSSYGFANYFDHKCGGLATLSLNGRHLFRQPIKVNWAYASGQREDPSSQYNICLGELSSEVTDATIFKLLMLHYSPFACSASSYGFANYFDRKCGGLATLSLNGRFGQPIKVNSEKGPFK
ncbi:oligouridylate-binding protein 1B-like [Apium graveolens]|uniref:oligouridylate-binding protein 1B-like n=1 Tax=Apium graveolens TaxID=4045 RepID=UPI003D7A7160